MTTLPHEIDEVLTAARAGDEVTIPAGWGQGRTTFGGIVGGILSAHALAAADADEAHVRALTVNFMAPAMAGPARLTTEILRRGKSATQLESRLFQTDDEGRETVRALALMTVGLPRASQARQQAQEQSPNLPGPDGLSTTTRGSGPAPEFLQHFDLRLAEGGGLFSGAPNGNMKGYQRFHEPPAQFTLPHLVTLIDSWPLPAFQMLTAPAPGSSMTWTMDFLNPVTAGPHDFWGYEVETDAAEHGYAHAQARLWDASGTPVVISRQVMAIFG